MGKPWQKSKRPLGRFFYFCFKIASRLKTKKALTLGRGF